MLRSVAQPQGLSLQDDLPAELRAKVYANMSPPFKGHIGEYQGILRANRFLKSEVEGEWTRNMCRFLEGIMSTRSETYSSPLRSDMPATIRDIKHVKIFFPNLHISSATFTFYEDENFKDDEQDQQLQALKKYGQGMIHFVDCMQQILDKVMRLKCDDGSSHLRKDIFNVDKLVVEWCALTSMEDTTLCLRVHWDDIKYRDVEQRMVGGKCVETTWNRYYASTGYGAERQILAYSRDLTNH